MSRDDRHTFQVEIDNDCIGLRVNCPYDLADETRPCWPHSENGDPDPAPQTFCNYREWCSEVGTEMVHGHALLDLPGASLDWSNREYPILQLSPRESV